MKGQGRTAAAYFSDAREDFDLSMMTDRYKSEWEANADWLKLSFHARTEFPEKPYQHALPETITADFLAVKREILRFAGEKSFSKDVTTVHFGEANPACAAALRDLNLRFSLKNTINLIERWAKMTASSRQAKTTGVSTKCKMHLRHPPFCAS